MAINVIIGNKCPPRPRGSRATVKLPGKQFLKRLGECEGISPLGYHTGKM